jgi:hypothetical protein
MTDNTTQDEPPEEGEKPGARASFGDIINSMDSRAWRAIIMSAASVIIVLALLGVGRFYFGDEITNFIDSTLGQANRGHWGLIATILVFTLTAYVGAPQIVLIGACVVAFGPELGFWNATIATIVSGAATYFTGRLTSAETQKRFGGATGGRFTRFIGKNGFLASLIVRCAGRAVRCRQHGVRRRAVNSGLHLRPCDRKLSKTCSSRSPAIQF